MKDKLRNVKRAVSRGWDYGDELALKLSNKDKEMWRKTMKDLGHEPKF